MSSDLNRFERLWKLEASAKQLVLEGKRQPEDLADILQDFVFGPVFNWARVYTLLGMEAEYAEFAPQVQQNQNLWTIPVVKGVTCNKVVSALRKLGVTMDLYVENLDADVVENDRDPNRDGSYTVAFRKNVEADEDNRNKSANQLKKEGHKGITLLERLLLELAYFMITSKHLDAENWTLCAGSRDSDGVVPFVFRGSDCWRVYVRWDRPDYRNGSLRSRSIVSSPEKPA